MLLDTETENLNLVNGKPFQLSWILADNYKILEEHDEYIYWKNLKVSAEAAKITKFDEEAYKKKAVDPKEAYERFSKDLFNKDYAIVGHNILNFDVYMIKNLQKLTGTPVDYSYISRCIDTRILFIALQKNIKYDGSLPILDWQYKVLDSSERGIKSSQQFLLNHFEIPHDKERLHEALYDITMLYEILKKILPKFDISNLI